MCALDWTCRVCGGETTDGAVFCSFCSQREGTWVCECAHLNKRDSTECEECGREKPEE